jgi:hypothetical protein
MRARFKGKRECRPRRQPVAMRFGSAAIGAPGNAGALRRVTNALLRIDMAPPRLWSGKAVQSQSALHPCHRSVLS